MSIQAAQLIATISVIGADKAKADLAATGAEADAAGKNLQGGIAMGAAVAGVALVALAAKSVSMAATFQSGMTSLVTGAGELKSNLGLVSSGILQMAVDTGTSTAQLTSGMYLIESAGYHGAAGLAVLQAAAEGAKVGSADLGTVANALTTVLTDYHLPATAAAAATSALIQTVADGKTHLQDLASSMGTVLPLASSLHISFPQVAGALATMTNAGMDAQRASMNLANAIRALGAPSSAAEKAMKGVGLSAQQLKDTLSTQGLTGVIQLVEDHINKTFPAGSVQAVQAFKAIMGGATGYNVALMLGGQNMAAYEANVANISAAMKNGSKDVQGWATVQQDFNFKLSQAQEVAETLGIRIGTALLPVVGNLVSGLANLVPKIADWMQKTNAITPILAGLGAMLISMVAPAIWSVAAGVIAATWPFLAIGVAVGGLVAIFQHFYSTNAGFKSFIDGLVNGLKQAAGFVQANFIPAMQQVGSFLQANVLPILQQIGSFLVSTFTPVWQHLVSVWQGQVMPLLQQLWGAIQPALPALKMLGEIILGVVVVGFLTLVSVISGVISAIATIVSDIASAIAGVVQIIAGVVQVITGIVRVIYDIFTGNFKDLGSALGSIWQGILNIFGGAFQVIGSLVHAVFGGILSFLGGVLNTVIGLFTGFKGSVSTVWNAITSAIGTAFSAIGTTIHNILSGIGTGIGNFFSGLGSLAQKGLTALQNAFMAPFNAIGALFNWLYQHNVYFQMLVDRIHAIVMAGLAILQQLWQAALTTITGWWNGLKDKASQAWQSVSNTVSGLVNGIISNLKNVWQGAVNDVSSKWNTLKGFAQTAWNNVSGVFSGAWGTISGILNGLWNNISKSFANAAAQALQWGQNIIQGIINGINNMLGALENAASNAAASVAKYLGFHSPAREGPGKELDAWPRNMMRSYAKGIEAALPTLQSSLNVVMQPVASTLSGSTYIPPGAHIASSSGGYGGQPNIIVQPAPVYLDGRQLMNGLMPYFANAVRYGSAARF